MDFDPFKEKARPIPNLGKGAVAKKRNTQSDYMPVSSNKATDDAIEEEETLTGKLKITSIAFDDVAHAIGSNTTFSGEIEVLQKPIEREILVSLIAQDAQGQQEIVQDSLSFQAEGNSFAGEIFLGNSQLLLDAQQQDPKATIEYALKAQNQSAKENVPLKLFYSLKGLLCGCKKWKTLPFAPTLHSYCLAPKNTLVPTLFYTF